MGRSVHRVSVAHPDPGLAPQLGLAHGRAATHHQGAQILRGIVLSNSSGQPLPAPVLWEGEGSPHSPPSLGLNMVVLGI